MIHQRDGPVLSQHVFLCCYDPPRLSRSLGRYCIRIVSSDLCIFVGGSFCLACHLVTAEHVGRHSRAVPQGIFEVLGSDFSFCRVLRGRVFSIGGGVNGLYCPVPGGRGPAVAYRRRVRFCVAVARCGVVGVKVKLRMIFHVWRGVLLVFARVQEVAAFCAVFLPAVYNPYRAGLRDPPQVWTEGRPLAGAVAGWHAGRARLAVKISRPIAVDRRGGLITRLCNRELDVGGCAALPGRVVTAPGVLVAYGGVSLCPLIYRFACFAGGADVPPEGGHFVFVPGVGSVARGVGDQDFVLSALRRVRRPAFAYAIVERETTAWVNVQRGVRVFRRGGPDSVLTSSIVVSLSRSNSGAGLASASFASSVLSDF